MKNLYKYIIVALAMTACSKDMGEAAQTNEAAQKEIPVRQSRERNLWPSEDPGFYAVLHSKDYVNVLEYYKNSNNFKNYTDPTQNIFLRTTLMGKLTYDKTFLANNLEITEFLLEDIFKKDLPCPACIVRIVKAAESNNSITGSKIPLILKNNKSKILVYHERLEAVREDCNCPEDEHIDTNIEVPNFEQSIYKYADL